MDTVANNIKRAVLTLAEQHGESLRLPINTIVTPNRKTPARRQVNYQEEVNLTTLSGVSVAQGDHAGLCIRMVFGKILFAVSGHDAEQIKKWAEKACATSVKKLIDEFPSSVSFQKVDTPIKVHEGEFVPA